MVGMKLGAVAMALALMVVFSVLALPGCGVKSAPIPPELARPERILSLHAQPAAGGIKLTWDRPSHYASGHVMRDLSGFVLMRGQGDAPMTQLVNIPVTDKERFQVEENFSYLDHNTAMGEQYRYAVIAETSDGYRSESSNEVEFTRVKPPEPPNPENYKLPMSTPLPMTTP